MDYEIIEARSRTELEEKIKEFILQSHTLKWLPAGGVSYISEGETETWIQALYRP